MASKRGEQGSATDRMRRLEEDYQWIPREKVRSFSMHACARACGVCVQGVQNACACEMPVQGTGVKESPRLQGPIWLWTCPPRQRRAEP
jgi:hypothetical protein